MRQAIRGAFYQLHRKELGCPSEAKCELIKLSADACSGCPKLLRPVEPEPLAEVLPRIGFLTKVESLHNIGCTFQLNDLPWRVWEELLMLVQERQRMERLVRAQLDTASKAATGPDSARRMAEARVESGAPPPGQSLFRSR